MISALKLNPDTPHYTTVDFFGPIKINRKPETCHVVVHPVEHDLRRTIPSRGNIARHLIVCMSRQAKVQDLSMKCKGSESAIKQHGLLSTFN